MQNPRLCTPHVAHLEFRLGFFLEEFLEANISYGLIELGESREHPLRRGS